MDLRSAFRQLRTYPVESALIVIALAVGVGALSAVAALYGVNDEIARRLRADLSAREFSIVPSTSDTLASLQGDQLIVPLREDRNPNLQFFLEDIAAVRELAPSVDYVYFSTQRAFLPKAVDPGATMSFVYSITADYTKAAGAIEVARGSWFSQSDFDEGRRVIVLAESYASRLGIKGDPLGQEIAMNYADFRGAPFTVIGVLGAGHEPESRTNLTVVGYVPVEPEGQSYSLPNRLNAAVKDPSRIEQATEELRHAVDRVWNGQAVLRAPTSLWQASVAERNRALLLAGFASIGLLMASLNIANLMLARVRRREKAVAILRSLGATRSNVRAQVLTEAALLGSIGGLLGILLSQLLLRALIETAAPDLAALFRTRSFPPVAMAVTLAASVLVTVVIGMVPAIRAAGSSSVPGVATRTDLAPGLPRPLRRNPARVVLTAIQLIVGGATIVVGLHVLLVGSASKPQLRFFTLDALNGDHVIAQSVFTPQAIDGLTALAPAAAALSVVDIDYTDGVLTVAQQKYVIAGIRLVGPEYLALVGADIIAGDPLSGRADSRSQEEILLEEGAAKRLFTTADAALGKELTIEHSGAFRLPRTYKVTGIYSYASSGVFGPPERVAALANRPTGASYSILAVATPAKVDEAKAQLIAAARTVYGDTLTVSDGTRSLDFVARDLYDQAQLQATLNQAVVIFTLMAITAVILAAVGIFSLSILNTVEQTRDIGIRRALGASSGQVAREIAGAAVLTAAISTLLGVAVAWLVSPSLSRTLSASLLAGIEIPKHVSLALITLGVVLAISGLLGWLVGLRATRASPSVVLGEEGV